MIFEYLEIKNVGIIENIKLVINKPLIAFYGEIKQGKTTILNCIKWGAGMKFPDDILRHGTDKGHIYMKFNNSSLKREFYRTKDGTTKAKKIKAIINGEIADKPIEAIKKLLNPFLLDQDFFIKKTALERQRYFLELLDIDKTLYDKKVAQIDDKATNLRAEIKAYGDIDVTPIEKVDIDKLKEEKHKIENDYEKERMDVVQKNNEIEKQNQKYDENVRETQKELAMQDDIRAKIADLEAEYKKIDENIGTLLSERESLSKQNFIDEPPKPNTTEIDEEIVSGIAQNIRREQYLKNMERVKEREDKKTELSSLEKQKKDEESKLMEQLSEIALKSNIPGLTFDKDANAFYENTALDMLSNAQQMSLSSALSALYPDGFGIELIDRGESLGKSIYEFIDKAKEKKLTILSAIVGERPAEVPDEMGVFVVEGGSLR